MQIVQFELTGLSPLLTHNVRLANPFDPYSRKMKEITAKRTKKTDDDFEELARLEFLGGMYLHEDQGPDGEKHRNPYIPAEWIEGMIRDGAKNARRGQDVLRGVVANDPTFVLDYEGSKDADKLIFDANFCYATMVRVQKNRVLRTRCRFMEWETSGAIAVDESVINPADVIKAIEHAGSHVGIGDGRPKFGRFKAKLTNGTS